MMNKLIWKDWQERCRNLH